MSEYRYWPRGPRTLRCTMRVVLAYLRQHGRRGSAGLDRIEQCNLGTQLSFYQLNMVGMRSHLRCFPSFHHKTIYDHASVLFGTSDCSIIGLYTQNTCGEICRWHYRTEDSVNPASWFESVDTPTFALLHKRTERPPSSLYW